MREIRTVADLLALVADVDPRTRIVWVHDGPDECCPGHHHDITDTWDCDARGYAAPHTLEVIVSGGHV